MGQLNRPNSVFVTYVDPQEEDDEVGRMLPSTVYFTEVGNHIGRRVNLYFGEHEGVIATSIGQPTIPGMSLGFPVPHT